MRASAVRTRLQANLFFLCVFVSIRNIFFPFITTLKLHISCKISLVSTNCFFFFFFFYFLLIFSPTVSIRIFINGMMLSCYLSMLVILNLLNNFVTFGM